MERYEILNPIGAGGLGLVSKARDARLNRFVAIKRLKHPGKGETRSPEEERKLLQEASLTGAVQHPNIVSVYDGGVDQEGAFLVMEYVDGETLTEVFHEGKLTPQDFFQIGSQVLEGLIAAQELGLIHRDLKPGNLMLCWLPSGTYRVKILDFGLAKYAPVPVHQTEDQNKAIEGTIHYMAPEQFLRQPLDGRTDLYALGCILYYGITGMLPFQGDSPADIMQAHLHGNVTPVLVVRPDLPQPYAEWLMGMLAREAGNRPENAMAALQSLQAAYVKVKREAAGGGMGALR
jgi:serine/threonine protein kinase